MRTAHEIAAHVGAPDSGPARILSRVSAIDTADREAVVFATDRDSLAKAVASGAGLILASTSVQSALTAPPGGPAPLAPIEVPAPIEDERLLWVKDARLAFAQAASLISPPTAPTGVHPTAILGDDVRLGSSVSIGPGAVVGDHVIIGEGSTIHARVVIYPHTELGARVLVQSGAVLGSTGFGYVRDPSRGEYIAFPQQGRLVIEDDVEIGANTTIDRGALGETRIGRGSKLDNLVHIGHNVRVGRNVIIAAQTGISGSSVIEDDAIIAGQVGIAEHVTIGAGVILGAKCGVPTGKKIRGAGEVFWGIPARPIREYLRDLARLRRS